MKQSLTARLRELPDNRPEKVIQRECDKVLKNLGFTVWNLAQARASKQSKGLADRYVTGHGVCAWIEYKTRTGAQTVDQVRFQKAVDTNRGHYLLARSEADVIAFARPYVEVIQRPTRRETPR